MSKNNIKLAPEEEFWMIAFLLAAKKISYNDIRNPEFRSLFSEGVIQDSPADPTCKAICDMIADRTFNFEVADKMEVWDIYHKVTDEDWHAVYLKGSKESLQNFSNVEMIDAIVKYCKLHEIYWDDTNKTPEEMRKYKDSFCGFVLWDYECFLSQNLE